MDYASAGELTSHLPAFEKRFSDPQVLTGYSQGTHRVLTGYSTGAHRVLTGCSQGTHRGNHRVLTGVITGYSTGTRRVLTGVITGYAFEQRPGDPRVHRSGPVSLAWSYW
jgi:hypothetical protein